MIYINCNTSGIVDPLPFLLSDGGQRIPGEIVGENRVQFILGTKTPPAGWGCTIFYGKGLLNECRTVVPVLSGAYEGGLLDPPVPTLEYSKPIPNFTRDEVCGCQVTLSGLLITTAQFGTQPWFELAYQCLASAEDRKNVRIQKKQAGDTGVVIEFFNDQRYIYPNRPGNETWLGQCVTNVGEFDKELFKLYIREILEDGLVPVVVFDGDNGDNPVDGYPNALRQLPVLVDLLSEYASNILFARFWDGVFYGSEPENIQNFGTQFRKLLPNGHLAIEFNPGHIPVGNGPSDYQLPDGMMVGYDVIVAEYFWPSANNTPPSIIGAVYDEHHGYSPVYASNADNWTQVWQINARLMDNYKAPTNQPFNVQTIALDGPSKGQTVIVSSDSQNPPNYLKSGNARGKYFFWAWELGEYEWVRHEITFGELKNTGRYFKDMGCDIVGFPS